MLVGMYANTRFNPAKIFGGQIFVIKTSWRCFRDSRGS